MFGAGPSGHGSKSSSKTSWGPVGVRPWLVPAAIPAAEVDDPVEVAARDRVVGQDDEPGVAARPDPWSCVPLPVAVAAGSATSGLPGPDGNDGESGRVRLKSIAPPRLGVVAIT